MNRLASVIATTATTLALAGALTTATPAHAQSACTSGSKVTAAIWEKYGESLKKVGCTKGGDKCAKMEQVVKDMIAFWNQQVGGSWATIGPREIAFEGKLDGKILAGGERLFVTKLPVTDADEVTVTVKKEGGKAPAKVRISLIDESQKCIEGNEVKFADTDKDGTQRSMSLTGVRDRLVIIKVDADKG
ncbi:MAG: hypothetical protein JNK04_03030, partial [Myxococcales bacterium]|nr:hypothetical protein [Myxococcales bacterium]